jgi:AraC-like DNA-binding protein
MERTSSLTWVKGVTDMFASQGLDVARLFADAGLDPARLDQTGARFQAEEISKLWELAVEASGNPSLGMDPDLAARFVNFDVVGYVMLASPSLRAGLESLAHYLALISDAATFALERDGANCWLVLGHIGNTRPVPRQRQEYGMLALFTLCRWLTRREIKALAVEFIFPEPVDRRPYTQAFDCPIRFDQAATRLLLACADLDAPVPSRDASMLALHTGVLDARLHSLGSDKVSLRVTEEILRRLHQGEPRRDDIARSLAMADRTLQRRLQEEGTAFQNLLDGARQDLARKYLAEDRHSLGQVADLLGFVDQSNFFRACKRWFGLPPGKYRSQMADVQAGAPNIPRN